MNLGDPALQQVPRDPSHRLDQPDPSPQLHLPLQPDLSHLTDLAHPLCQTGLGGPSAQEDPLVLEVRLALHISESRYSGRTRFRSTQEGNWAGLGILVALRVFLRR